MFSKPESNVGNDSCGKCLKIRFKPFSSYLKKIARDELETFQGGRKHARSSLPFYLVVGRFAKKF